MRLWIERSSLTIQQHPQIGQPRMRLWIDSSHTSCTEHLERGQPRMRLWIERPKRSDLERQPRVSLVWGCELKGRLQITERSRTSVSLVWGCELKVLPDAPLVYDVTRSASYEAVNWKSSEIRYNTNCERSASYEAVNWKIDLPPQVNGLSGQPRMRLWIESLSRFATSCVLRVSLVWGCELKGYEIISFSHIFWSASYEAVNWKANSDYIIKEAPRSASYEAVNWKSCIFWHLLTSCCGQPRMRLWIERIFST